MQRSDWISIIAVCVSFGAIAFNFFQYFTARRAGLKFRMNIARSYATTEAVSASGVRSMIVIAEQNPTTHLLIRNMSSRPSGIVEIRAKNPHGDVLLDVGGQPPGGVMPLRIEPWAVEIITTTWPAGEHTEGMCFVVKDIDEKKYTVSDSTNNRRIPLGEDIISHFPRP